MVVRFSMVILSAFLGSGLLHCQSREFLYVGTFSVRGSEGIYIFSFDRVNKKFENIGTAHSFNDPTFLTISPDNKHLYTANRQSVDTAKNKGSVTSFAIHPKTGLLTEINSTSSFGNSPCHISTSPDGKNLLLSHYRDGSLTVLTVDQNGRILGLTDSVIHRGSSIDKQRQETSHAHSTLFIPETNYTVTADLGTDKLWLYKFKEGKLSKPAFMTIQSTPGSGPRHFDFYKGKPFIYVAEELSSTVSVFSLDYNQFSTVQIQRISTLPDSFAQANSVADIHFSPDQKFLYVSNRGHNSLAIFKVDSQSGKLMLVDHQSTQGKTPRNFYMDAKGEFVLVANQDSDEIVFFTRDSETGLLNDTGTRLKVPSPVCLKMGI